MRAGDGGAVGGLHCGDRVGLGGGGVEEGGMAGSRTVKYPVAISELYADTSHIYSGAKYTPKSWRNRNDFSSSREPSYAQMNWRMAWEVIIRIPSEQRLANSQRASAIP